MKKILGLFLVLLLAPLALKADNEAPAMSWRASATYTVTTITAQVQHISLTYTAQAPYSKVLVTVVNVSGGTLWFDITTSPSAPTSLTAGAGCPAYAGGIAQVWGPYACVGHWIHLFSTGSSSTAFLRFETVP